MISSHREIDLIIKTTLQLLLVVVLFPSQLELQEVRLSQTFNCSHLV
ncbi:hypothetical protein NIES2100_61080 [Calothrix sp. NIES-2100]|nr:hypothetical protein NIES2100_61080 [Calothrix sp. NIES-2100]